MTLSAKLQPIFIIVAAFIGLLLGYTTKFGNFSVNLIEPFLMMLLYFVFLTVDGKKFKESFKNIRFYSNSVNYQLYLDTLISLSIRTNIL